MQKAIYVKIPHSGHLQDPFYLHYFSFICKLLVALLNPLTRFNSSSSSFQLCAHEWNEKWWRTTKCFFKCFLLFSKQLVGFCKCESFIKRPPSPALIQNEYYDFYCIRVEITLYQNNCMSLYPTNIIYKYIGILYNSTDNVHQRTIWRV